MMSGLHPSQIKRKRVKVKETHKNMKYTKEDPVITLIEDDVEFMADKVHDKGKRWFAL
jgi:hypothetical protein